jgi:4-alpha-glucanotransferase
MKVLQFAFDGDPGKNPHLPHNYDENCLVYTGTHDNNTIRGWFIKEATAEQKTRLFDYLGQKLASKRIHWELIRLAMSSVGRISIIPMQDVLGLSGKARLNRPASNTGNWRWRLEPRQITTKLSAKLRWLTQIYGRS